MASFWLEADSAAGRAENRHDHCPEMPAHTFEQFEAR
jgi:hypothetical protein